MVSASSQIARAAFPLEMGFHFQWVSGCSSRLPLHWPVSLPAQRYILGFLAVVASIGQFIVAKDDTIDGS